jgi:hypothetical protein
LDQILVGVWLLVMIIIFPILIIQLMDKFIVQCVFIVTIVMVFSIINA